MLQTQDAMRTRLLRGLPVTTRHLDIDGISTQVLEGGQGPSLLLLHGGIEAGGVYWAPVLSRLTEQYRVVVPDVPGLGESAPLARLDTDTFAGWFATLLHRTCPDGAALVAHSLNGSLAARFAADHGEQLRRLVIIGAPGLGRFHLPPGLAVASMRCTVHPSERNLRRFLPWPFLDWQRTAAQEPQWFESFTAYMVSCQRVPHAGRAMRQLLKAGTSRIPDAQLRRISVPTTLIWGRHDRMVPLRIAEDAGTRFGWPLHVIDNSGHVPFVEQPAAFLTALEEELGS
ncbi:alpha/beta fold hydrolase [Rhodococcus chondri]|uniref:Alpha/beta hydrolase n=1 Tax=Rhodococcus chondri TaxID=3065941 RepID=A0ABU7JY58_9NOCA|nr:alpha/beta hydrolase [Rhodococcus sp. CC-R104]MEE2034952.1 alpha/beta hydrolase [Rhodococcus sp. CC-R104]